MKNSKYFALFAAVFAFVVGITGCEVESEKHEHTFSKEWTSDAIAHWHAATCEHKTEISGIAAHTFGEWKVTKEATEKQGGEKKRICSVCKYVDIAKLEHVHTFGEWAVTKEATESEEGERQRTCSVCKYVEKETVAKLEHTHTFSEKWASDGENHWHAATCEHKTEISDKAAHIFGEWTVTKEATENEDGIMERSCSICEYSEKVHIAALNHTHKFSDKWISDETEHWHIAICGHTEVSDKEFHQWNAGEITKNATCTENGEKTYTCTVCGKIKAEIETIPPTGHSFSTVWTKDAVNHWHAAVCGDTTEKKDMTEHTFGEWIVTKVATETECGEKYRTCSICNYEDKRIISNILGSLVKVRGKEILGYEVWEPTSNVFVSNRKLTIPTLYVSDHEVTIGEYIKIFGDDQNYDNDTKYYGAEGPCTGDAASEYPVAISWLKILVYCNKLSMQEGLVPCYTIKNSTDPDEWGELPDDKSINLGEDETVKLWNAVECNFKVNGYRLPTEVEWEYLARGGQNFLYSGSNTLKDVGWYTEESATNFKNFNKIKQKKPNGYGLYDMSGNLSEYCWDVCPDVHKSNITSETPFYGCTDPEYLRYRVLRGGSHWDKKSDCKVNSRGTGTTYGYRSGFRVVRTVTE